MAGFVCALPSSHRSPDRISLSEIVFAGRQSHASLFHAQAYRIGVDDDVKMKLLPSRSFFFEHRRTRQQQIGGLFVTKVDGLCCSRHAGTRPLAQLLSSNTSRSVEMPDLSKCWRILGSVKHLLNYFDMSRPSSRADIFTRDRSTHLSRPARSIAAGRVNCDPISPALYHASPQRFRSIYKLCGCGTLSIPRSGRQCFYRKSAILKPVSDWVSQYSEYFWTRKLDALGEYFLRNNHEPDCDVGSLYPHSPERVLASPHRSSRFGSFDDGQ